jgi:polar amino acid transport system substrate-binding protein
MGKRTAAALVITLVLAVTAIDGGLMEPMAVFTGEWRPFVTQETHGYGVVPEIVTAVLHDMGIDPGYTFLHYYKCYDMVREDGDAGAFPFHRVPDREKEMFFSDWLFSVSYVFFYRRGQRGDLGGIARVDQLSNKKVAVMEGYPRRYSYGKTFGGYIDKMAKVPARTELEAFGLLRDGEVDFVPASKRVGREIIRRHFNQYNYDYNRHFSSEDSLHFIVSKAGPASGDNKAFMERFNASLAKLRANGVYGEIKRRNYDPDLDLYRGEEPINVVRLSPTGSFPLILGRDKKRGEKQKRNKAPAYIIPNGTRAVIKQWSEKFRSAAAFEIHEQMFAETLVQLLEGPLKGKRLWVKNLHIELE